MIRLPVTGLMIFWISLMFSDVAYTQGVEAQARAAFHEGISAFEAGDTQRAVEKFRQANALHSSWKLLYNIGQCEALLNRHGLALEAFEAYLSLGGVNVPAERHTEVLAELDRLRPLVGFLMIRGPAGAEIWIDDVPRGQIPLHHHLRLAIAVDHRVVIEKNDEVLLSRTVRVGGGDRLELLVPEPVAVPPPESPVTPLPVPVPPLRRNTSKTWGWVGLGAGAALLAGGAVTGGLALSINGELDETCPGGVCPPAEHEKIDKRDTLATLTNVLLGVGAAAALAGTLMLTVFASDEAPPQGIALVPVVRPTSCGATVRWRF